MKINFPKIETALYLISTPIGTISDITFRAVNVLQNVNILLAEDTRVLRKLMNLLNIDLKGRIIHSYNDNSGDEERSNYILELDRNKSIALCCDAGTPLISDPGFKLVKQVLNKGHKVISIPGPVQLSLLYANQDYPLINFFAGFPPVKTKQKVDFFNDLISIPSTIIFFESPKRIIKTLKELGNVFGSYHNIAICRELTKNFEENKRGSISSIINSLTSENKLKGEFTVIVDKKKIDKPDLNFIKSDLNNLLKSKTLKDSVLIISQKYSLSRREVYNLGLEILKS